MCLALTKSRSVQNRSRWGGGWGAGGKGHRSIRPSPRSTTGIAEFLYGFFPMPSQYWMRSLLVSVRYPGQTTVPHVPKQVDHDKNKGLGTRQPLVDTSPPPPPSPPPQTSSHQWFLYRATKIIIFSDICKEVGKPESTLHHCGFLTPTIFIFS